MAAVLNHQIIGSIDNINHKISSHARIILNISMELDRLKSENEELKKILKGHKIAIKKIRSDGNNDIKSQYAQYQEQNDIDIKKEISGDNELINSGESIVLELDG